MGAVPGFPAANSGGGSRRGGRGVPKGAEILGAQIVPQ